MPDGSIDVLERPEGDVEIEGYAWKAQSGFGKKLKPEDAAAEVKAIFDQYKRVTPDLVIERATPAKTGNDLDNPLHAVFEWDNLTAGAAYREVQARNLIRALVVVYKKPSGELAPPMRYLVHLAPRADDPALDSVTADITEPKVYLPIRTVMDEAELRRRYVRQAFNELVTWRQRYRDIDDFAQIFEQIDRKKKELDAAA